MVHTGDEHGYYSVKKGDTLHRIALDNGQNYRDLVTWNNLSNPNDIKVDPGIACIAARRHDDQRQRRATVCPCRRPAPAAPRRRPRARSRQRCGSGQHQQDRAAWRKVKPYSEATLSWKCKSLMRQQQLRPLPHLPHLPPPHCRHRQRQQPHLPPSSPQKPLPQKKIWSGCGQPKRKPVGAFEDAKKGLEIPGKTGQQIVAAANGKIVFVGYMHDYGNIVIIKHNTWNRYSQCMRTTKVIWSRKTR